MRKPLRRRAEAASGISAKEIWLGQAQSTGASLAVAVEFNPQPRNWSRQLRLLDGMLDALETFWRDPVVQLTLICQEAQIPSLEAELFTTPRLSLRFAAIEALLAAFPSDVAARSAPLRGTLLGLSLAAQAEETATLILALDTFPIRPWSAATLFETCAALAAMERTERNKTGADPGVIWQPNSLFGRELAAQGLSRLLEILGEDPTPDASGESTPLLRSADIVPVANSAELGFWSILKLPEPDLPLMGDLDVIACARNAGKGWSPQPWKSHDQPYFVRIAGATQVDPEPILSHIYATFDR